MLTNPYTLLKFVTCLGCIANKKEKAKRLEMIFVDQ